MKNGTLDQGNASSYANTAVIVNGGSLTVGEKMTIQGSRYDSSTVLPAITVESGSLTLTENTNLYGGMKVTAGGKLLKDYLPEGTAFAVGDSIINGYVQSYVNGDTLTVVEHTHSYTDGACVCGATCLHDTFENGVCTVCGYACPHPADKVTAAGEVYTCSDCEAQMAVKVEYTDVNGAQQTKYYAQTRYTYKGVEHESTLKTILNDDTITPSGSKITLLANDLLAFAFVHGGKTVTLNLNGKNLIETVGNGITVDEDSKLIVTGEGSSTRTGNPDKREYSYVFNVRGGTLEFRVFDFGGTFNGIRVGSGTLISYREKPDSIHIGTLQIDDAGAKVSFKAAAFDKIVFGGTSGSVKLGDLLGVWQDSVGNPVRSGNAFQKADGTLLPYDTKITGENPVENVETAACHHDSVTGRTCDYCGTENLTAIVVDGGGAIATYATTDASAEAEKTSVGYALNGWNDNGNNRTLKLFVDVTLTADVSLNASKNVQTSAKQNTIRVIDLNGHSFTGADGTACGVSVNELVTLTIQDNSAGEKGEFANVTVNVNDGGSLIVDGVHMGTITATDSTAKVTLKAGSSLEGYSLPAGMMLADWIEDGCFIYDTGADGNARIPVALTAIGTGGEAAGKFVVEKAAAQITAGEKIGELPYGSGVPVEFCPGVTLTDAAAYENFGFIKVDWYRRTDSSCKPIGSGTIENGSYAVNLVAPNFDGVEIGDRLDVFCILTAVDNTADAKPFWQTVITGYELTVVKGNSSVITAPAATAGMVYKAAETDKTWSLVTAGTAEGGTMVYSLSEDGTYTEAVPTAENAGSYTVWYKVRGDGYHEDTEPESVIAEIAKAKLTISSLDVKEKTYDGTTDAEVTCVYFKNSAAQTIGSELVSGTDYTVTAAFENANAGSSVKLNAIVTLLDTERAGNYELTDNKAQDTCEIRKADAAAAAEGTLYILNNRTDTYEYDLSRLLPELTEGCDFGGTDYGAPDIIWEKITYITEEITVDESGMLLLKATVNSSAEEDAGTVTVTVTTGNYKDITLTLKIKSTDKKLVELKAGSEVSSDGTLTYGQKLSELAFKSAIFVEKGTDKAIKGKLEWSSPDAVPAAGTTQAGWVFMPEDSDRYHEVTGLALITVEKADPVVAELPAVAERIYNPGRALADSDMTGGTVLTDTALTGSAVSVAGVWSFTGTDIIPTVDNNGYEAIFTPIDSANYNTVTRTITVKVTKAEPYISGKPSAGAIIYGATLADSALTGGRAAYEDENGTEIAGAFTWKQGSLKPTVSDSGVTEYEAVFTPADTVNYDTVNIKLTLTVNKAAQAPGMPGSAMQPAHSVVRVGDITLPDGWNWSEADRDKELEDNVAVTAEAVYAGADKGNYETECVSITITRSECGHGNTEIRNEKAATCAEAGYTGDTYCNDCGKVIAAGAATAKKPHTVGTPATCVTKAVCSVCGGHFGEEDTSSHVHTTVKNQRPASCTQTGYTGDTYCADCGRQLAAGRETAALGHDYSQTITKEPTTTEEGVRTYTCSRCNDSYTESIAMLPDEEHTHSYTESVTRPAGCTDAGVRTYTCDCGDSYTEAIPAVGHSYVSAVTKEPTTTEEGIMTYTCTRCGHSYMRPLAKLPGGNDGDNRGDGSGSGAGTDEGGSDRRTDTDTEVQPYIKDDNEKKGWEVIRQRIETAATGSSVAVAMNGTTVVPKDIFDNITGKDVTLALEMENGVTWKINGKDITKASGDIDFGVVTGVQAGKSIPDEVKSQITGEHSSMNLTLSYDGEFGFTARLAVNMASGNAGLYANLFYYNEQTGKMEFVSAGQIGADGSAELSFTHASDYIIVVAAGILGDSAKDGAEDSAKDGAEDGAKDGAGDGAYDPEESTIPASNTDDAKEQFSWNSVILVLLGICIILAAAGAMWYVKKRKGDSEK